MSYLGSWAIDDNLTFAVNTHAPATGAATDADAVPAYRIYEDETVAPILTGNMALLDAVNTTGFYSEQIALTAANGFEVGKCYSVYISAAVGGVTGTISHTFQMLAEVNVAQISGDGTSADNLELDYDGTGYAKANSTIGTTTTNTDMVGTNNAALAATALTDATWTNARAGYLDNLNIGEDVAGTSEISALNDISPAQVNAEVDQALVDIRLDHLVAVADADDPVDDSIIAKIAASDGDWSGFSEATDSLEAISDAVAALAVVAFPAGANAFTYTVTDGVTLLPIEGVEVWFSTDIAGVNIVWKGDTDTFGVARDVNGQLPFLDTGTFRVWVQKSGYTFINPDVEAVP